MALLKEGSTYLASVDERELYFKNRGNRSNIVIYVEVKVLQIIEANEHDRYYKVEIRDPEGSAVVHWLPEEVFVPKRWLPGEDARFSRIEIIKELE
jgi:hypothetical protein|nr:MAG TPA: hypothetical protein [Caudoviricetes sp.]